MQIECASGQPSLIDVLDRVLDKGVVLDAWARVSFAGIDLITVDARVVIASIQTYLYHSVALAEAPSAARPGIDAQRHAGLADSLAAPREPSARLSVPVTQRAGRPTPPE